VASDFSAGNAGGQKVVKKITVPAMIYYLVVQGEYIVGQEDSYQISGHDIVANGKYVIYNSETRKVRVRAVKEKDLLQKTVLRLVLENEKKK
jgi:hypothetical protein